MLKKIGGHDDSSPVLQGLFSFRDFYGYAVSSWPRELVPRYTVVIHIASDADPTTRGLANNICQQREYLAALLPAITSREPALVVIDKYFTAGGCTLEAPTKALQRSIAEASTRVSIVVGLNLERGEHVDARAQLPPLLIPPLQLEESSAIRAGVVNRDISPRRIPLGWTVRTGPEAKIEWRNGLALEAALAREPKLFEKAPRLQALKSERDNPFTSIIPEKLFTILKASDVLCTDKVAAEIFKAACATATRPVTDASYLRGRIAIVGETGSSVDRHDTNVVGEMPGTVLQANYVEALLDERYFVPAPEWFDYLAGFLFFVALEFSLRGRRPIRSLGLVVLVVAVTFGLLSLGARYFGYYVDPAVSVLVLVFMLIAWIREMIAYGWEASHASQ